MNTMMDALKASRKDAQVSPDSTPMASNDPKTGSGMGDMHKYWMMMKDMNTKMDQILKLLSGNRPADEAKENEPNGNGNGY